MRWNRDGSVTALGTPTGFPNAQADGINDLGTTVGLATTGDLTQTIAVSWDRAGTVSALPVPPGTALSGAVAVNDRGTVAGFAGPSAAQIHAVEWRRGGSAPVNRKPSSRPSGRADVRLWSPYPALPGEPSWLG